MGAKQSRDQQILCQYKQWQKKRKQQIEGLLDRNYDEIIQYLENWKNYSLELLNIQLKSKKYNDRTKVLIKLLILEIKKISTEEFIITYQNKLIIDQLDFRMNINYQQSSRIQIEECQLQVEEMMNQFKRKKIRSKLQNNCQQNENFKKYIIEKDILQHDHFIMIIYKQYWMLFLQNYSISKRETLEEESQDYQEAIRFISRFQIQMVKKIYKLENINQDISIKALFQSTDIFQLYLSFINKLHYQEIQEYKTNLQLKQNITLKELGASDEYLMIDKEDRYCEVIEKLNQIYEITCPVTKFELIGNLKFIICESLDKYHNQNKIITIDSDHFLIILIYSLIKLNQSELLSHIKLIQFTMSKQIEINRGQNSWLFVSLLAAFNHICLRKEKENREKSEFYSCIETVLQSQMF